MGVAPKERLQKLFDEFPALFEYCEVLISNWIDTVCEFLNRLETDLGDLNTGFAEEKFTCPVVALQAGLSDPHRGGGCVVRLTFNSGSSLLYKPRSVASEAHFSDLLKQFNEETIPHAFSTVRCWERNEYGWMEDVKARPCCALAEIHAFYWRAGALLALVYLARGVDMHRENLIAAGEFPVLIDLEALWHPQEHVGVTDSPVANSVLRTGFLPQADPRVGAIYNWNALSNRPDPSLPSMVWTSINQDNMTRQNANRRLPESRHEPVFAGTKHFAPDYLPDILAGFRWIGRQVLEDRRGREKFQRWMELLTQCPRRRILRSSSWYRTVLEQLTAPPSLRKKGSDTLDLTSLNRSGVPLTESEWRALRQLDIPWLEQESSQSDDPDNSLSVHTMDELLAQESLITEALNPVASNDRLLTVNQQVHQGMIGVHSN